MPYYLVINPPIIDLIFFPRSSQSEIMWSIERSEVNLFLINMMCHIYRCMEKESTWKAMKSP